MSGFVITSHRKILEVDPDEVMDFIIDLSSWMPGGDTIGTVSFDNRSTVTIENVEKNQAPLTIPDHGEVPASQAIVFWARGGTLGTTGPLTFRVLTLGGRSKDFTYQVVVGSH